MFVDTLSLEARLQTLEAELEEVRRERGELRTQLTTTRAELQTLDTLLTGQTALRKLLFKYGIMTEQLVIWKSESMWSKANVIQIHRRRVSRSLCLASAGNP